jgi:RimJ/RimL family protein N-acetyltransferase
MLRPWLRADVPENVMGFAHPSVLKFYWPLEAPYTEADAHRFFESQEQARLQGRELNFAFARPGAPDSVLGGGSLYEIDPEQCRAAVGYWLAPEARGCGVATHATRLMAGWAFEHLGIQRLELTCGPDNEASQRVAIRCGFVCEGLLRSHVPFKGERRDTMMFSLLPSDLR